MGNICYLGAGQNARQVNLVKCLGVARRYAGKSAKSIDPTSGLEPLT